MEKGTSVSGTYFNITSTDLIVKEGATISAGLIAISASSVLLYSGSSITATGKGSLINGSGPGVGVRTGYYCSGAGHGGNSYLQNCYVANKKCRKWRCYWSYWSCLWIS